jgi:heme/copper-type cytochrome/quinol oxidase subunit 2
MITSNASGHKAHGELEDTGFTVPVEMIILAIVLIVAGAALYFNDKRRRARKKAIA